MRKVYLRTQTRTRFPIRSLVPVLNRDRSLAAILLEKAPRSLKITLFCHSHATTSWLVSVLGARLEKERGRARLLQNANPTATPSPTGLAAGLPPAQNADHAPNLGPKHDLLFCLIFEATPVQMKNLS